jgi:ATP-dependent protease ClpP protease subunit
MTRIILPLCVFFLFAGCLPARAESAKVVGYVDCDNSDIHELLPDKVTDAAKAFETGLCWFNIQVTGEINSDTVVRVRLLLEVMSRLPLVPTTKIFGMTTQHYRTLTIDSPGGDIAAAMSIGRMLRKARIRVFVPKNQRCVSACIMIFAAAVSRDSIGKIGIHRPYFNLSNSRPVAPADVSKHYANLLQEIRSFLREMNVSEQLADDMLAIEPANVRYLSRDELMKYGLRDVDPVEQETRDLQEAQSLGLDRGEYIRRQALQKTSCDYEVFEKQLGHELGREPSLGEVFSKIGACEERVMEFGR